MTAIDERKGPLGALLCGMILMAMTGCSIPFRAPPDVADIALERVDSPVVVVDKIWLERKNGVLVVTGYVLKRLHATDTTRTHLEVTLYDKTGHVLRSTVTHFTPREIIRRQSRPAFGRYRVPLDPLPPNTARIKVAAREDEPH